MYDSWVEVVQDLASRVQDLEGQISEADAPPMPSSQPLLSSSSTSPSSATAPENDDLLMMIKASHPAACFDSMSLLRALAMWNITTAMPIPLRLQL